MLTIVIISVYLRRSIDGKATVAPMNRLEDHQHAAPAASIERRVEWVDTDASGHQHNSSVMRWVEAAEAQFMLELGLTDYFPAAPRVNQTINYRARLWFGQGITATVWVERLGTKSLTFGFNVLGHAFRQHAQALAASGTFTTVYLPPGNTASEPWPEHYRAALKGTSDVAPAVPHMNGHRA